jgi:glutamate synthase (NADPH/NADH) large chain
MSGGIAYVLDESQDFDIRCNMAMVDLEPISDEDRILEDHGHQRGDLETHGRVDIMSDMNGYDALRLRKLIENHLHYTNSDRAREILDQWDDYLPKFVKVMPVDYRRALQEMQARLDGNDQLEVDVAVGN